MSTPLEIAISRIGTVETGVNKVEFNDEYYGRHVSGSGYPWCAVFVWWCFREAGTPLPYKTASCSSLLGWYRINRPECVHETPEPGDIVIYNFGHAGIVETFDKGPGGHTVTAVEGNTTTGYAGSQDNGGGVWRKIRDTSLVKAYIRPDPAPRPDEGSKWSAAARRWAVDSGIVLGDGTGEYAWGEPVTREQEAVMLHRLWKLLKEAE